MNTIFGLLFLFVFLDVLGFSIILPLLPYYAEHFAAPPTVVGLLLTANALAQFITAPLIGRLSDLYGRRPLLLLCVTGTFISFVLLYYASSTRLLFVSRIMDGILGGNISLAQAYISDVMDEKQWTKGMGLLGAAFGLAFIFGPALGAIMLNTFHDIKLPALLAATLCLINLLGIYFYLPEPLVKQKNKSLQHKGVTQWWWIHHFPAKITSTRVLILLGMRFCYGFAFSLFETTFGLYISTIIKLPINSSNLFYVYIGLLFSAVQMLMRRFVIPSKESHIIIVASLLLAGSLAVWPLALTTTTLLLVLAPFSIASGILNTLLQVEITKAVIVSEKGGVLGVSSSLGSLTRVLAPIMGAYLFENIGYWAPPLLGTASALSIFYLCTRCLPHKTVD